MIYRLLPAALDDLDEIDAWVAESFGPAVAAEAQRKLFEVFALLAQFPEMGVQRPDVTSRPVRFFSSYPNWIIYEPGIPLLIHRVFPAARDLKRI